LAAAADKKIGDGGDGGGLGFSTKANVPSKNKKRSYRSESVHRRSLHRLRSFKVTMLEPIEILYATS